VSVSHGRGLLVVGLASLLAGCTGLELPALGAAALSAGAGSAVKAGTEYTMTGTAYRTFSLPLEDLARHVRHTLERLELPVTSAAAHGPRLALTAEGIGRTVRLELVPISPALTRLKLSVKQGVIRNDRSTASELIAQIEREVGEAPVARAGK
jgi:hypothetical protein